MNRRLLPAALIGLCSFLAVFLAALPAWALITGGVGNEPIQDPGWPAGAAAVFNVKARVAWWEGPPFGGGQWTAECRGDTAAFNAVLADFAKIDARDKRLVVHDGGGRSVWLKINREKDKEEAARIDWSFMVWQTQNWMHLGKMPGMLPGFDPKLGPPTQLDVYASGAIVWKDVTIPAGLKVVDERLEAHGFKPTDGPVLEGTVFDLETNKPIGATVRLQEYKNDNGKYVYSTGPSVTVDSQGRWILKNVPNGQHRIVAECAGYVPRVIGHASFDGHPRWAQYDSGLARPALVAGRVVDDAGRPLPDVAVHTGDLVVGKNMRYDSIAAIESLTDADGRFSLQAVATGTCSIWIDKSGYTHPGLGPTVQAPKTDLALTMSKSAKLVVTIDFGQVPQPAGYIVELEPEGGNVVGSWGGSGNIDAKKQMVFNDVPPGRYFVCGHPNPSSEKERTKKQPVELKGGETLELTLPANLLVPVKPPLPPRTIKQDDAF